jgi:hypothetical protein
MPVIIDDTERSLRKIREKMVDQRVRPDSIVHACEAIDKNRDELIHADDLEDVLHDLLGASTLNRREIKTLTGTLEVPGARGKAIEYKRLTEVLEVGLASGVGDRENRDSNGRPLGETWRGGDESEIHTTRWAKQKGSVGEWLTGPACPAEQKNFKKFINAMERFERDTGMRIQPNEEGFVVPIGPDLRASVKFFMS